MLTRRTKGLFVNSKALVFVSRNQRRPPLFSARRHNSHSPAGPSADIRKAIFEEARLLQKHDKSIPWYRLVAKYRFSIGVLQSIYNQAEVDAERRRQQSALVTRTAERLFDDVLGRCNWEEVASELDLPLLECLDLFDAANSTIQPRSLIETYGGWAKADTERLKQFTVANYADSSTVDWKIAGAYMNIDSLECQRVGLGTFNDPLNEVGYRRICELRESGLSWKDIHQYFLQYHNYISLKGRYEYFIAKLEGRKHGRLTSEWTDVERERMTDLIKRHVESASRSELVGIIKRELSDRPLSDIRLFIDNYAYHLKAGYMRVDQMARLRELVHEYGEDWGRIGEALNVLPARAQFNWIKHGGDVDDHSGWSADETLQLRRLTDSGVKPQEAARLLGGKSQGLCQAKVQIAKSSGKYVRMIFIGLLALYAKSQSILSSVAPRRRGDTELKSNWSAADDDTLLKMVDGSTLDTAAKWEHASNAFGRSAKACRARFYAINRKKVADDREKLVTSEVQRRLESNSTVDWSQVSQETGLPMRECLELNQYDVGKVKWRYDPDSFSLSMVNRMTSFTKEHYPVPVPVNYRAVSNFMWINMDDCILMRDMLLGKFKWTEAKRERAAALRAQGLTYKEIARHLSPTLTASGVYHSLRRHLLPKEVREPISTDELEEVSRLVDEYAGKYPVSEIIDKIYRQVNLDRRYRFYLAIPSRIASHPYYQTKLRGINIDDIATRIATGQTTIKLVAKEFDVPHLTLRHQIWCWNSKLYSPKWTEEETRKLVDYVQTCDSKPDCVYFSKLLGTKSSRQCIARIFYLRRTGVLPCIPKGVV
ncbi:hypothetical protein FBU31_002138 [Coemansia sp. 'formosensis']|nr:hypothetical protein FBU31_002138 [Coemansia sp. 'formosensis']